MSNQASLFGTAVVETEEEKQTRLLQTILDNMQEIQRNQNSILTEVIKLKERLTRIETTTEKKCGDISKQCDSLMKCSVKIANASRCAAAHALNNGRKLHGATAVLDPVRQFIHSWYQDQKIPYANPLQSAHATPQPQMPSMNPNSMFGNPAASGFYPSMFGHGLYQNPFLNNPAANSANSVTRPTTPYGSYTPGYASTSRPTTPSYAEPEKEHHNGNRYQPYQRANENRGRTPQPSTPSRPHSPYNKHHNNGNGYKSTSRAPRSPAPSSNGQSRFFTTTRQPQNNLSPSRDAPRWPESPSFN